MPLTPQISDWQHVVNIIEKAVHNGQHDMLLTTMLTSDEREALIARANILNELLKGELSQRQISQMLGVGVATVTRGSNELKSYSDEQKTVLFELLRHDNCT